MKKTALWLALFLSLVGTLGAQESLAVMRRQLYENGQSEKDRADLWKLFKGRVYPLNDNMLEARLENNLNVLGISILLLLDRAVIWQGSLFHIEIAEMAERNYRYAKEYLRTHKNTSASFRLAYTRLMLLITPILNRIDRTNLISNPVGNLTQYDDLERMKDLAFDLVKEDPENPDHWMLLAEYRTIVSNHTTMTHSALALRHLKKAIKMYDEMGRREDLAWAYLWQSSLFMRRSLNSNAKKSLEKARELFPKSFLVDFAEKRLADELPWM